MYEIYDKLLKEKGISSYQISKMTGISTATLSDWKKGRSKPKHDKMVRIAECLGVDVEYLETGNPNVSIKKEPNQKIELSDEDIKLFNRISGLSDTKQKIFLQMAEALLATLEDEEI